MRTSVKRAEAPKEAGDAGDLVSAGRRFENVVTGMEMPLVSGCEAAISVKAASPAKPIVLLMALRLRIIEDGEVPPSVNQVVSKPPKMSELSASLARLCSRRLRNDAIERSV